MIASIFSKSARAFLLLLPLIPFLGTGCRGPALTRSFSDYSLAYAQTMNDQILLNLARRANGHPAYFLQMGSINSVFSFEGEFGSQVGRNPSLSGLALGTLSGNLNLGMRQQPAFSFTPLSGRDFASGIFEPVNPNVFYALFNQGHNADQLIRMMVQSVQFYYPKYGQSFVLANTPNSNDPGNYIRFLRFAGMARQLQMHHKLHTAKTNDVLTFKFESDADALIDSFSQNKEFGDSYSYQYGYEDPLGETPIEEILKQRQKAQKTESEQGPVVSFRLRTFYEVLSSLATEQRAFDTLVAKYPDFLKRIPPSERRPTLRFYGDHANQKLTPPVVKVNYFGQTYQIADDTSTKSSSISGDEDTWNRDVFILLSHLYHQIAVDPSKLPAQQLIQVQ